MSENPHDYHADNLGHRTLWAIVWAFSVAISLGLGYMRGNANGHIEEYRDLVNGYYRDYPKVEWLLIDADLPAMERSRKE
jgi:hypothetical protein